MDAVGGADIVRVSAMGQSLLLEMNGPGEGHGFTIGVAIYDTWIGLCGVIVQDGGFETLEEDELVLIKIPGRDGMDLRTLQMHVIHAIAEEHCILGKQDIIGTILGAYFACRVNVTKPPHPVAAELRGLLEAHPDVLKAVADWVKVRPETFYTTLCGTWEPSSSNAPRGARAPSGTTTEGSE